MKNLFVNKILKQAFLLCAASAILFSFICATVSPPMELEELLLQQHKLNLLQQDDLLQQQTLRSYSHENAADESVDTQEPAAKHNIRLMNKNEETAENSGEYLKGYHPPNLKFSFVPDGIKARDMNTLNTVFLPDEREPFSGLVYPFSTIGRIETAFTWCTGTLIGRRLVLTASHCIPWTHEGNGTQSWVKFTPLYHKDKGPLGTAYGVSAIYWRKIKSHEIHIEDAAFDYVIVVLDIPIGDHAGYMGAVAYDPSWNERQYWSNVGYPNDHFSGKIPVWTGNHAMVSNLNFEGYGKTSMALAHNIDSKPGHSGGPYFGFWQQQQSLDTDNAAPDVNIVAVCSAESDEANFAGGGASLVQLISHARERYP